MTRLALLSHSEQKKYDSCPKFNKKQRAKYFSITSDIAEEISSIRKISNQVGFMLQLGYFRASGRFFPTEKFRVNDIKYVKNTLELEDEDNSNTTINFDYNSVAKAAHKKMILAKLSWTKWSKDSARILIEDLKNHIQKQLNPESLMPLASQFLITNKIELPPYYVLCEIITHIYNDVENELISIVSEMLSQNQKEVLDDLIWIDDKRKKHYKFSALSKTKSFSLSTKIDNVLDAIENYKLLKAFNNTFEKVYDALKLPEESAAYFSTWVKKAKLFQLKQFKDRSKAHLYILAHIKYQYNYWSDLFVDMALKMISGKLNTLEKEKEKRRSSLLKAQSKTIDKISKGHRSSKNLFNDIFSVVWNTQLDSDQKVDKTKGLLSEFRKDEDITDQEYLAIEELVSLDDQKNKMKDYKSIASSYGRKLAPIFNVIDFVENAISSSLRKACKLIMGKSDKEIYTDCWLSENEIASIHNQNGKLDVLAYKGLFYYKMFRAIKSGKLNLKNSYRYLPIDKYLIEEEAWDDNKDLLLRCLGVSANADFSDIIESLNASLNEKYQIINEGYCLGSNKHLSLNKKGRVKVSTPGVQKDNNKAINNLFSKRDIISVGDVLSYLNSITNFTKTFKHHSNKNVKMKPTESMIFAGLVCKGCNHDMRKMANISKGITEDKLKNTINWFFSLENIHEANNKIIEVLNSLDLPLVYKANPNINHTSSDGQKFIVNIDSILANYSFKYFGTDQGVSVYSFIDDRHVLFHDTVISPTEREATYVIDGLLANHRIKSDIHSTDSHGYSEVIFATTHLLGISFAPRIKDLGSQIIYSIEGLRQYPKKDFKIRPDKKINVELIRTHWDQILRFIATIKSKKTTASQLFKRLNSYTTEHTLYKALKEFGRIIKSIYLLTYVSDLSLRQQVQRQLNKIELSNRFSIAVFFADSHEFKTGVSEEQILSITCKSFIQNCIVLWNYLYLSQEIINAKNDEVKQILINTIKKNSVLSWAHVNFQGEYDFMVANDAIASQNRFNLDQIRSLKVA